MYEPLVTVVIPSLNQAQFLPAAIESVLNQSIATEVFVMDGGSTDDSVSVIESYEGHLAGWVSKSDGGQAAAINAGMVKATAPFVTWLNSDDTLEENGLANLHECLNRAPDAPAAYGRAININCNGQKVGNYRTFDFSERLLANYCFICQPATLIRRSCWAELGGLDESLHLALDYDLWWRLYNKFGPLAYDPRVSAANRQHAETKTQNNPSRHYEESMRVVKKYYGSVPLKWHLMKPIMPLIRSLGYRPFRKLC